MFSALSVFHDLTMKISSYTNSTFYNTPTLPCFIPSNICTPDSVWLIEDNKSLSFRNICSGTYYIAQADQKLVVLGLVGAEKIIFVQPLCPVHYLILVICNKSSL